MFHELLGDKAVVMLSFAKKGMTRGLRRSSFETMRSYGSVRRSKSKVLGYAKILVG